MFRSIGHAIIFSTIALSSACATASASSSDMDSFDVDKVSPVGSLDGDLAATEFQLNDERNGGVFDSTAHAGKALVIEFYFNTCPYCNDNAPNVEALFTEYPTQVIEVSVDCDRSDYTSWFRKHPSTIPTLNDCDGSELADRIGARGFPTVVVLDSGHNVVHRSAGVWSSAVKRRIRSLLSAP